MLYKANFCAECGEKIGVEGFRLTNRFLCEKCAVGRGNQHLFAPVSLLLASFLGIYFIGSVSQTSRKEPLKVVSSEVNSTVPVNQKSAPETHSSPIFQNTPKNTKPSEKFPTSADISDASAANFPKTTKSPGKLAQTPFTQQVETIEASYFCGAKTQKGTPCLRKVKGGGRCWQHPGKPAMFPPEKLLIQP